jgi:hypothetical protein
MDLKGTRAYSRLLKAFEKGLPPPKLTTTISAKFDDCSVPQAWGETFNDTVVQVERENSSYQPGEQIANLSCLLVSIKLILCQPRHHFYTVDSCTTSCAS